MICDLAETYHIYNYRGVPGRLLGILASGLRSDSRCVQAIAGQMVDDQTMILAQISDQLSMLGWNGKGQRPEMLTERLMTKKDKKHDAGLVTFENGAAFEKHRAELLERIKNNGDSTG